MGNADNYQDLRSRSVQRLAAKFNADPVHGTRVGRVALQLFAQLEATAPSASEADRERSTRKLGWSAQLHEIGSHISHSDSHKHGAYILDNADAMGFAQTELHRLSLLVLGHRGKLGKLDADFGDESFVRQLLCLRMAVILCHARREPETAHLRLGKDARLARGFVLACRAGWAEAFPQSAHLLREEALAWQKTPWSLSVAGV